MTIKEIRSLTGLSQTDFGNKYNIPMRTIQNWEGGQRKAPAYVEELLEFKVRYDIERKKEIKSCRECDNYFEDRDMGAIIPICSKRVDNIILSNPNIIPNDCPLENKS